MNIPVLLHKDANSVYGVTVPDIAGCFSFGNSIKEAMKNVREAIASHIDLTSELGTVVVITPTPIEELIKNPDLEPNGIWALINIEEGPPNMSSERFNVSMPHCALKKIDDHVKAIHDTRSGFLCRVALEAILLAEKEKISQTSIQ